MNDYELTNTGIFAAGHYPPEHLAEYREIAAGDALDREAIGREAQTIQQEVA